MRSVSRVERSTIQIRSKNSCVALKFLTRLDATSGLKCAAYIEDKLSFILRKGHTSVVGHHVMMFVANIANAVHLLLTLFSDTALVVQVAGYLGLEGSVSLLHAPHRDDDAASHL